jgi:DNA recombination protein RmuC
MDQNTIYILAGLLVGFAVLIVFLNKKLGENTEAGDDKSLLMLQQQINQLGEQLNSGLAESRSTIQQQFASSTNIIKDVTEKLTNLENTNKEVVNFSSQLQNLQDILNNPKQRGIYGEYSLETLLKNAFSPKDYKMQYSLGKDDKTGKELIVDAALFLGDRVIPIDSKFSLENYVKIINEKDKTAKERLEKDFKQDLKKRIDETSKYIRPEMGTVEYAFMFIPAEGIFYDLLVNEIGSSKVNSRDLLSYATVEKKVHIVSPTTFFAALQSTFQGMRAYQIQESTKEIIKNVSLLSNHLRAYQEYYKKLGNNLATTVNCYNAGSKEFNKIDKDVTRIAGEAIGAEMLQLEKPNDED